MDPEKRSAINTANATRHGWYAKDKVATTKHCETMLGYWTARGYAICDRWSDDLDPFRMAADVLAQLGKREDDKMLRIIDESWPIGPGNVEWVPRRRKARRGERPPYPKLDRVCPVPQYETDRDHPDCRADDRCRELCAQERPCGYLIELRWSAVWDETIR